MFLLNLKTYYPKTNGLFKTELLVFENHLFFKKKREKDSIPKPKLRITNKILI